MRNDNKVFFVNAMLPFIHPHVLRTNKDNQIIRKKKSIVKKYNLYTTKYLKEEIYN